METSNSLIKIVVELFQTLLFIPFFALLFLVLKEIPLEMKGSRPKRDDARLRTEKTTSRPRSYRLRLSHNYFPMYMLVCYNVNLSTSNHLSKFV